MAIFQKKNGRKPLERIEKWTIKWFGHVLRMAQESSESVIATAAIDRKNWKWTANRSLDYLFFLDRIRLPLTKMFGLAIPIIRGNIDCDLFVKRFLLRSIEASYSPLFFVQVMLYVSGELFSLVFLDMWYVGVSSALISVSKVFISGVNLDLAWAFAISTFLVGIDRRAAFRCWN